MKGKNILIGTGLYLAAIWALYGKKSITWGKLMGARPGDPRFYQSGGTAHQPGFIGTDSGGYVHRTFGAERGVSVYSERPGSGNY